MLSEYLTIAPKTGGIYIIENQETGRKYIGKAQNFRIRWSSHFWNLEAGKHHNTELQEDWEPSKFIFYVHTEIEDKEERRRLEHKLVTENVGGYNSRTPRKEGKYEDPYGKAVMENLEKIRLKGFI
jgi:excinuclease UvrABC nuclease subunit